MSQDYADHMDDNRQPSLPTDTGKKAGPKIPSSGGFLPIGSGEKQRTHCHAKGSECCSTRGKKWACDETSFFSPCYQKSSQWITSDSILQELTVASFELFRIDGSFDDFLERMAIRLGCFAIAALDISSEGKEVSIFASAGLSRKSRSMHLTPENIFEYRFPWPEVNRRDALIWNVDLDQMDQGNQGGKRSLVLFRSNQLKIPDLYLGMVKRIIRIFCRARYHHHLMEKFREQTREINKQKELLRSICDDMLIGVIFISNEGVVLCNERARHFFDLSMVHESLPSMVMKISKATKDSKALLEKMLELSALPGAMDSAQELQEGILEVELLSGVCLQYLCRPMKTLGDQRIGYCWYFNEIVDDGDIDRKYVVALEKEQRTRMMVEQKNKRTLFLAEAGRLLVSSNDRESLLRACIQLCVPLIADAVAFELTTQKGVDRLLLAGRRAEPDSFGNEASPVIFKNIEEHLPVDVKASAGPGHVLATGITELWPTMSYADIQRFSSDPKFTDFLKKIKPVSAIYVPLIVRGTCFGVMSWARLQPTIASYSDEDRALAEDFASRVSLALENARLLKKAELAVAERDEFFSVASHELRTPVTSFKLATQCAQRLIHRHADRLGETLAIMDEPLKVAVRQSERLERFITKLLSISTLKARYAEIILERFSLSDMVKEMVLDMADEFQTSGCEAVTDFVSTEGVWDRFAVDRILSNLISNALKFGGSRPVEISVWNEGGWAFLSVKDGGIGISESDRERIFSRYVRGVSVQNYSGFGIGLSIISELVGRMGGFILLDSAIGQGTKFIVALPLVVEKNASLDDRIALPVSRNDFDRLESTGILSSNQVPSAVRLAFDRGHRQM